MTFMENSYVTTKAVMNSKSSSVAKGNVSQVTSGANQAVSRASSNTNN
jgi:hypothetical protein